MKKLNMGCGKDVRQGYVNLDMTKFPGVDVVHDLDSFPYPFKANTFDYVLCDNVLEHLDNIPKVMQELHRICKNGAKIRIMVPYYNSKGATNDVTHRHFFNYDSFQPFYQKDHRSNNLISDFNLVSLNLEPTNPGRLIPGKKLRWLASTVVGEIIKSIDIVLEVRK